MQVLVKVCGKTVLVRQVGEPKIAFRWGAYRYAFKVRVYVGDLSADFDFYGSLADHEAGKDRLSAEDLKGALRCFLEDALSYIQSGSIDAFAEELGYTKISEAVAAFEGCKAACEKLSELGIEGEEDLCEAVNSLEE